MINRAAYSIFAIIALGIIVYSNTFFSSFHFDDDAYIINDFAIRNLHNLHDIWNICPCRFLTFLTLAINYHFSQLNVLGFHLFNLAVHLATALLVWWLVKLTFATDIIALLAALIFVSHPVQIEAVTYIWQRAASLSAFFYLLSLCFYIKSRLQKDSRHYYILSIFTAIAAMFTKENAITLPLMILLYEFSFLKGKKPVNWAQLYPFWIIMFIIPQTMVLSNSTRFQELRTITGGPGGISPAHYLFTQFRVIVTYIRLIFLPLKLNLDYDYPIYKSFFEIPVITSFLFIAAILYAAKRLFAKYRLISFSIFWFFLTLLPESSILPQTDVIFEHRLYLPLVGYCMLIASGAYYLLSALSLRGTNKMSDEAISKRTTKFLTLILSFIIAFNSILTFERNKIWANEITLWNDVVAKSPNKARAYINRGWAFYNQGNFAQALSDYNKAIAISPEYIYSYDDKGLIYVHQGDTLKAIDEYNRSIKINPYYPKVYYHRAAAYLILNKNTEALSDYDKAIELNPEYIDAYNGRARLYASRGKVTQAISDYTRSLDIDPGQSAIKQALDSIHKNMIYIEHHDRQ